MKLPLIVIFTLGYLTLAANYVQNRPTTYTQPDGTVLDLFVTGDEYYHRVHDTKGYTILINPKTNYAVYAIPDGKSIQASDFVVGKSDPAGLGIQPNLMKFIEKQDTPWTRLLPDHNPGARVPPTGSFNNIVIFLRFSDQSEFPASPSYSWYNNKFNATNQQSLKDYYDEVSNGQLNINSYVFRSSGDNILSIQATMPRGWYSPLTESNLIGYIDDIARAERLGLLIAEICSAADPYIPDDIDTDVNNDGANDGLTFVIRGPDDDWGDLLWSSSYTTPVPLGIINGVPISHFIFIFENFGTGVINHEMGHNIGFPDLYRYPPGNYHPVGPWSVMANSEELHSTAYEKKKYGGWFDTIPVITPTSTPTQYTLTAIDQNPYACYLIHSTHTDQDYILEYRRKQGRYEVELPQSGLIAYRVTDSWLGTDIIGNSNGPKDEVYVFRPNGNYNDNGYVFSAAMSAFESHNGIHNSSNLKPWLYSNTVGETEGSLAIVNVGDTLTNTITFTVLDSSPNVWTGLSSNNWSDPTNWYLDMVPTSDQWVEIPGYFPFWFPNIIENSYCKHLTIKAGASLQVAAGNLFNNESLEVFGLLKMNYEAASIVVTKDLIFHEGSTVDITVNNTIHVQGNLEFEAGSSANFANGTLRFYGNGNSNIRIYDAAVIYNFDSDKNDTYATSFSGLPTESFTVKGSIMVRNGSAAYNNYSGNLLLYGNISVSAGGVFQFDTGTVTLGGLTGGNATLNLASLGNYLNNLTINKHLGHFVQLSSVLQIRNSLDIISGFLIASAHTIYIWGDWMNEAGSAGFSEDASTVIFNGTGNQFCNWGETFYNLEINKPSGEFRVTSATATVTCNTLNFVSGTFWVSSGVFTANDLIGNGISGNWWLTLAATVNLYNYDGYVDLNGNLNIDSGDFNVYGGTDDSYWSYGGNSSLELSGGTLDFHNTGIRIYNSSYTFSENITGGTIRTAGSFIVERDNFHPSGGWIELVGTNDAQLSHAAGSSFYSLKINKHALREDTTRYSQPAFNRFGQAQSQTRYMDVTSGSNLVINDEIQITAGSLIAPALITISGNWTDTAGPVGFIEGTGQVVFNGSTNTICTGETFNLLEINKTASGEFHVPAGTVTCNTYNWTAGKLNVSGGTFTALDMVDDAILGIIYLNNGFIHLHQDSASYVDLRADITILGGELHVYGGTDSMLWPFNGNASLTMYGGVIDVHDRVIYINPGNTFTVNITGGTIRAGQGFYSNRADFMLTAGTVEMYSSSDANLNMMAGSLYNLTINKSARSDAEPVRLPFLRNISTDRPVITETQTRTNAVTAMSNFSCHNLTVNTGTLNSGGKNITCTGNVNLNSGGVFNFGSGGTFTMASSQYLFANSGSTVNFYGTGVANALFTAPSGYYSFNVESGATIKADYTIFQKMDAYGIQVKSGATVDPAHAFTGCTFRNGLNTGTLLLLDSGQNLLVSNAVFPANTWSGSSNVKKTVDAGVVNFAFATGAYSGESFDNDVYNRILWTSPTAPYDLYVAKAVWSSPNPLIGSWVQLKVTCLNAGTASISGPGVVLDLYYNQTVAPAPGAYGTVWLTPNSFPAGVPMDYIFNVFEDDNENAGQWTSWLQIDTDNNIQESNETNNIFGPFYVNWIYLPPITNLTISHQPGSSYVHLNWTYQLAVNWFGVYRSTDPDFTPTPDNLLVWVTYPEHTYMDTITSNKYFYIVTAALDDDPQRMNLFQPEQIPASMEESRPSRH